MLNYPYPTIRTARYLATAAGLILTACSHAPSHDYPESANPSEEITKLEGEISGSCDKQGHLLSPTNYKKSIQYLSEAKQKRDGGKGNEAVLHELAKSRGFLVKAQATCQAANPILSDVVAAREAAVQAEAPIYYKAEFEKTDQRLKEIGEDLEEQKSHEAEKHRAELQAKYLDLEVQSMKEKELGSARQVIQQAIQEGAKEYAPRSLKLTQQKLDQVESYITVNRRNSREITQQSEDMTKQANHLLLVTRKSKTTNKANPEELVLAMEDKDQKIDLISNQANALEGKGLSLEKENLQNKQFDVVKNQFDPKEAEVYKDGSKILIRLKALNFEFGKHVVEEQNYPLLTKVQDAIRSIGDQAKVTIEGHSDARGKKAANLKISTERANAVKNYLVANRALPESSITAIGYGDERPLRSNKNNEGRMVNRRVDVIIDTSHAQEAGTTPAS